MSLAKGSAPQHAGRRLQAPAIATPVPYDIAGSAGQPLSSDVRAFMEPRLGYDLGHVRIHTEESAARSAERLDADAYTFGSHISFANGRFAPGTGEGNELIAHELVHSIQQVQRPAGTPRVARRPRKAQGLTIDPGMRLGTNRFGDEVRVVREVGSNSGYDHRLQAIAVARLAGAEPAVVALGYDRKWHAFETTANFYGGGTSADAPAHEVYGLPSSAAIAETQQSRPNSPFLASLVFGVPESEIQMNTGSSGRTPGKINLNPQLNAPGQPGGTHGTAGGGGFVLGAPSSFDVRTASLAEPAVAQATLFHEVTHLRDYELAQQWAARYERETRKPFVSSALRPFMEWLDAQTRTKPSRLSAVDAELIKDEVTNASASTEARANVLTFLAVFQTGSPDLALKELVAYANALKPGVMYQNPLPGSQVQVALTAELRDAYRRLRADERPKFRSAFAAAKASNPDAWVSKLAFAE